MFIVLWRIIVNLSSHTKCVSLSNQNFIMEPAFINLHPNEYSQEFNYYPFVVKLVRWVVVVIPLKKVCVLNKKRRFNSKRVQHGYRK